MPYSPYNLGNVLSQGENIINSREQRNPNSLRNQYIQAQINALRYEAANPEPDYNPTAPMQNYDRLQELIDSGATPEQIATFKNFVRAQQIRKLGGVETIIGAGGVDNAPLSDIETEGRARQYLKGMETTGGLNSRAGIQPVAPGELNLPVVSGQAAQPVAPVSEASLAAEKATAVEKAQLNEQLKTKPKIEAAIVKSKFDQNKQNVKPKMIGAADAAQDRTESLKELIQQARTQANRMTVGFVGNMSQAVAGTPAFDLSQTLLTLQANAGFDRLQEMRNNSVTGGALGQVSERELGLLMAAYAALDQKQSKGQFLQNLDRFEKQVDQSWKRVKLAYRLDYGEDYKEIAPASQDSGWTVEAIE